MQCQCMFQEPQVVEFCAACKCSTSHNHSVALGPKTLETAISTAVWQNCSPILNLMLTGDVGFDGVC